MIARILLFLSILSLPARAQIQVLLFDGATETPVGSVVDMGSAAPGDVVEVRLRVRNIGSGATTLQTLSITLGSGFKKKSRPRHRCPTHLRPIQDLLRKPNSAWRSIPRRPVPIARFYW